jgi:hypothetical protein
MTDPVAEARENMLRYIGMVAANGSMSCVARQEVDAFIAAVRAEEREACAKVADALRQERFPSRPGYYVFGGNVSDAIRARGTP